MINLKDEAEKICMDAEADKLEKTRQSIIDLAERYADQKLDEAADIFSLTIRACESDTPLKDARLSKVLRVVQQEILALKSTSSKGKV